ncbi:hypothetical protein [Marinicrinis lubricantis]|uniref:DUF5104 domain-containing protein n=1 Tax=Marinicrinis lubricantis TaxID=2086470 RepID=A0ABW1IPI1_9BACL
MRSNRIKMLCICAVLMFLIGCENTTSTEAITGEEEKQGITEMEQLLQENAELKEKVMKLEKEPSEAYMMTLREMMNLSFKIIVAMDNEDYEYLSSVSASGVSVDREKNQIVYMYDNQEIRLNFLEDMDLSNMEYWGFWQTEDEERYEMMFAHFVGDTHGTIYMQFMQEQGEWRFAGFMTNA